MRSSLALAGISLAALSLTACGSDDSKTTAASSVATSAASASSSAAPAPSSAPASSTSSAPASTSASSAPASTTATPAPASTKAATAPSTVAPKPKPKPTHSPTPKKTATPVPKGTVAAPAPTGCVTADGKVLKLVNLSCPFGKAIYASQGSEVYSPVTHQTYHVECYQNQDTGRAECAAGTGSVSWKS